MKAMPLALALVALTIVAGCGPRRLLVPVHGRVFFDGQPLAFGSVSFQGASGQPATAAIGPDGTFVLAVIGEGPGAFEGRNRVIVACYEGQRRPAAPSGGELHLGASLIPERCTSYETSGLVIDVQPGMRLPVELQLTR